MASCKPLGFLCLLIFTSFESSHFRLIRSAEDDKQEKNNGIVWSNAEEFSFEDFKSDAFGNSENQTKWQYEDDELTPWKPYIGIGMCLLSSILCGLSYPIKRYAIKLVEVSEVTSTRQGVAYVMSKTWLLGQSFVISGELLHYFAFYFAQAIIVCTVQILTVLVAAFASSKILNEKTNKYSRVGIALALSGCWIVTLNAPSEEPVYTTRKMLMMMSDRVFLSFLILASVLTIFMGIYLIPKYGDTSSFYYTFETALLGSIIMIGIKGLALAYTEGPRHWLPWTCLLVLVVCLVLQITYINQALEKYNTLMVTIQFYMAYSACTIIASTLLFKLWKRATFESVMSNVFGLINIVLGVLLYTIFEIDKFGITISISGENKRLPK